MPNTFAYIVLFSWPLVALVMYLRMPLERAFVWTIIGGYLFLPPRTGVDLPLLSDFDKFSVTTLTALVLTLTVGRHKVSILPKSWLARILLLVFVLGTIPSVLANPDPVTISTARDPTFRIIPGLDLLDSVSLGSMLAFRALPLIIGREILSSPTGRRELLRALMIGGLIYTIPSLIEIRLSPQLNIWIFGFFQHDFIQMMRDGGFRPIVFLPHALNLALFLVGSAMAAAGLARTEPGKERTKYLLFVAYLMLVIVLCKSMASLLYMSLLIPVILFTSEKTRLRLATLFVLIALAYPALRHAGLVPLDDLVNTAASISEDRARSLAFRFNNEELLLAHAQERPLFGWGGWGRNLLYNEWSGRTETITDGQWIIILGMLGLTGFIGMFGTLASSVILAWRRMRKSPNGEVDDGIGTLALMVGITMLDMLINAPLYPFVWMIAGAVLGWAEGHVSVTASQANESETPDPAASTRPPRTVLGAEAAADGPRTVL